MEKKWWKEAVAYQIYPRSFKDSNGDGIGDIQGVISKLDYLKDLGIDVIWICPIYQSPNDDNGYDISDYQDIMSDFGTMADFDELLEEVHKRDMKLIMDLVINHTSDEHPWFVEARSSKDNPYRDYYIWHEGNDGNEPNNWESIFNGSAWEFDDETKEYYLHVFSKKQPDLNWENKAVRQELYNMVNWWLDKGIDGFRVDAISHIKKVPGFPDLPNPEGLDYVPSFEGHMNRPGIQEHLSELKEETFAKYDIMTVGEANGVTWDDADEWVGAKNGKFDMIFQFEHMGLWDKGESEPLDLVEFKTILTNWQKGLAQIGGWNALYLENHDHIRSINKFGSMKYREESAKCLAALYFLMQGTPFIYQGQELGMTNVKFNSIEDYNDVGMVNYYRIQREKGQSHEEIMKVIWETGRDNSRTPMQWDRTKNAGFSTGTPWMKVNPNYVDINVEQQLSDEESILNFYKKLITLRKQHEVFVYGTYDLLLENHPAIYAYTRTLDDKKAIIICNVSSKEQEFKLPKEVKTNEEELLIHNYQVATEETVQEFTLRPYETRVYFV
ncbi:glucohydrolase [Bacillus sp. VT 712]|uniref:Glucohydrolase n=2 Tax=Priestia TaxID=2800373 RepID=A0A0V8JL94_9BACI|nr:MULTISPECIES: alpha-glucosidase [Bacillaceae]KSU87829.1 glucohydrolase [Priestia veravalensis]KZB90765.1 glucohydrolase [Bacillus sp. VT 712]MCG7312831.1 alpha-glucosidase [Priestia flexa]MDW8515022.1 alpha-glucosidase [Priestia flexa]MEC0664452.1 alpha-glucosidase [Priestia flexa]